MSTRVVPVTVTRTLGATKNSDKEIIITYVDLQEFLGELNCYMEHQASLSERPQENCYSTCNSLPEPRKPTKDQSGNWCYIFFGASIPVVFGDTGFAHKGIRHFDLGVAGQFAYGLVVLAWSCRRVPHHGFQSLQGQK